MRNYFLFILLLLPFFGVSQTVKKDTLPPVITAGKDTVITVRTTTTIAPITIPGYVITSENSTVKHFKETTTPPPVNQAPTARAGADQTITQPASAVTLNGGASTDPDGVISSYLWQKINGPAGGVISSTSTVQTQVTGLNLAGVYTYRLIVTDNAGALGTDDVIITVIASSGGAVQNFPLSFTELPFSSADLNAPGRGVEQWHNANEINVPTEGVNTPRLDVYYRFVWTKLEGRTQGSYNWAYFDGLVNSAIDRRQKMNFGIMTVFPGNEPEAGGQQYAGGGWGCYPEYLHNLMQGESVKDFLVNGTWTPNYNSLNYYNRLLALHQALDAHINATTYNGVKYKDVINIIDIRGYGAWGEWHSSYLGDVLTSYPAGTFPNDAGFKRLVDAHTLGFPNTQLVAMIAAFDAHYLNNTWNSPFVANYILNVARNNVGSIGWRRDQWGSLETYLDAYLVNNNRSYNGGVPFNVPIMERYKTAPITGEPPNYPIQYVDNYSALERQIRLYHASSFGNGNYGTFDYNNTIKANIRAASKAAGYRLQFKAGNLAISRTSLTLRLDWQNVGIAPAYENYNVVLELVNSSGAVAWSANSSFNPKLFLPQATATPVNDVFTISVPAGTYTLRLSVKDPANYRQFLPLSLLNLNANNSINLKTGIVL